MYDSCKVSPDRLSKRGKGRDLCVWCVCACVCVDSLSLGLTGSDDPHAGDLLVLLIQGSDDQHAGDLLVLLIQARALGCKACNCVYWVGSNLGVYIWMKRGGDGKRGRQGGTRRRRMGGVGLHLLQACHARRLNRQGRRQKRQATFGKRILVAIGCYGRTIGAVVRQLHAVVIVGRGLPNLKHAPAPKRVGVACRRLCGGGKGGGGCADGGLSMVVQRFGQ
eukprot:366324-Chlamydomonas_euryale.AAC.6